MTRTLKPVRRSRTSCSVLALATVMAVGATPAHAQFVGTIDSSAGIDTELSTNSNLIITGQQAVINWTATDDPVGGQIVFLPDANSATFTGTSDFAVLNRVMPGVSGNAIYMGGTITSLIGQSVGGTVYFYSPDGIVIGSNAVINVGSLGLTTIPILDDGQGNWITGFGGSNPTITFGDPQNPTNPNSFIRTNAVIDGSINALNEGSYVAMVAPRVEHHGRINVNGAAALVGAEGAVITFRPNGLFDIQVTTGSDDVHGVYVDGTITGPASSGTGDNHRIYAVAVPKNDLITLTVAAGAELGFDIAQAADVVGNKVVLSAGHDVSFGSPSSTPSPASAALADISVVDSNFTSAFLSEASGHTIISSFTALNFASDVTAHSGTQLWFSAQADGATIDVGGNLFLSASKHATAAGQSVTGGIVDLYTIGAGTITVAGNTTLESNGSGGSSGTSGVNGGSGTGGRTLVQAAAGGSINLLGNFTAIANGIGGSAQAAGVNGGNGTGGDVRIETIGDGASVSISGNTHMTATGNGGHGGGIQVDCSGCNGLGGVGTGGNVGITTGGSASFITASGIATLYADGFGGTSALAGSASATGFGGSINIAAFGGSQVEGFGLTFGNNLNVSATGRGGQSDIVGITAGVGDGGNVFISANANSTMGVAGALDVNASGYGGYNNTGIDGGDGIGGLINMTVSGGNAAISVTGAAHLTADGEASVANSDCTACGGAGGDGFGGDVFVNAGGPGNGTGNSLNFASSLDLAAEGWGGIGVTGAAGNGQGGDAHLGIGEGATVTIGLDGSVEAEGYGGYGFNGNNGGDGTGGVAAVFGSGGILNAAGIFWVDAAGEGGDTGIAAGGIGGDGTGGQALVNAGSGTLNFNNSLFVEAGGLGGTAAGGTGGSGTGRHAEINAFGGDINIGGSASVDAKGTGGGGATGGDGTGGGIVGVSDGAHIRASNGGDIDVDFAAFVEANGQGGSGTNGNGGNGTGGWATMDAGGGGTIDVFGTVEAGAFIEAFGFGGNGVGGIGGHGFGGTANLISTGGILHFFGDLLVGAGAEGGDGNSGGNATGRTTPPEEEEAAPGLSLFVSGGGLIDVDGSTFLDVAAFAGDGSNGNGGAAIGGEMDLVGQLGTISLAGLTAIADATGGAGGAGGAGGNATGGLIDVAPALLTSTVNYTISTGETFLSANAQGGAGGAGVSGAVGGNGGAGGAGSAGAILFVASAGGGTLNASGVTAVAFGNGGAGGAGGIGSEGTGGNGGTGGLGEGGSIFIGSISNEGLTSSGGGASFGAVTADSSAVGGAGGNGGTGTGGNGAGGNGGAATGGDSNFLIRGITASAGIISLSSNATGGNGGSGSVQGNGGNAATGFLSFESKDRFGHPTQRGTLTADALVGTAVATGGTGATAGTSTVREGNSFRVLNGDATIGSVDIEISGDLSDDFFGPDLISVRDGTATITGDFAYTTTGGQSLDGNNGSLSAANLVLGASNFLIDTFNPAPTSAATYSADTMTITTGQDFLTTVHLDSGSDLTLMAPGSIATGNLTAATSVFARANGTIGTGTINAGTFIDIRSGLAMTLGHLVAGDYIDLRSNNAIAIGNATSGETINFLTAGALSGGNLTAGNSIAAQATGAINLGTLSAGIVDPSQAAGAEYSVRLSSGTSLLTGAVNALGRIGFFSAGTLTTGNLDTGVGVTALGDGDMVFGSITTPGDGYVYLADDSMAALGGTFEDFDVAAVLAAAPVQTSGSITINGPVTTGTFQAAAGTFLSLGALTANTIGLVADDSITGGAIQIPGDFSVQSSSGSITFGAIEAASVDLNAAGSIATGAIDSGGDVTLVATGNITTLDVSTFGDVVLNAGGTINAGDILAGTIDLFAVTSITTGDLTTQIPLLLAEGGGIGTQSHVAGASVWAESEGDITTGNVSSMDGVFFQAGGDISTGTVDAVDFVEMLAGGGIGTLAINAGGFIFLEANEAITTGNLTSGADIDLDTFGSISFGNVDAATEFDFDSGGTVSGGDIVAGITAEGSAEGAVTLGDITAGFGDVEQVDDDTFSVGITSATSIEVGDVNGAERVGFATLGDLTTGSLTSGWDVMLFVGGDLVTGAIASGEGDQVYIADASMCTGCGSDEEGEDLQPETVLALAPVATGGSITINGPVSTGLFRAAAGENFIANDITALGFVDEMLFEQGIVISAGGTIAVNGGWNAEYVDLTSNDINITAEGSIQAFGVGLTSTNAEQTVVGDGVDAGLGYHLSDAEFDRIDSDSVEVGADAALGAATTMIIGDLSVAASGGGEDEVEYEFATYDGDHETGVGSIRIVGDVVFTGMRVGTDDEVNFATGTFELDAATGSLSLTGNQGELAGDLDINATHIHIAEGAILDQLAVDPQYEGYRDDLNAPAAVQRPEGVIRAGVVTLEFGGAAPGELYTLYVQNTGTEELPAGFLVTDQVLFGDEGETELAPGSLDLAINGQIETTEGTLTGIEVRDALVESQEGDLTPFTENSTVNGCQLTGPCQVSTGGPEQPPPGVEVTPTQVTLLANDPLGEVDFGNEQEIDDNEAGDEADSTSPIEAPQPLFDTRPLTDEGVIDDPVSGTGNPALLGGQSSDEDDDDDEDEEGETQDGEGEAQ